MVTESDKNDDELSDEEATRRAKDALRRAFATPPDPRKPTGKKGGSPAKPKAKRTRKKPPA